MKDLNYSLGHAQDAVLRASARQMGIEVVGRLGYCDGCAGVKGIREAVAMSTSCRAETRMRLQLLYGARLMAVSAGGARYYPMITDDATNMS